MIPPFHSIFKAFCSTLPFTVYMTFAPFSVRSFTFPGLLCIKEFYFVKDWAWYLGNNRNKVVSRLVTILLFTCDLLCFKRFKLRIESNFWSMISFLGLNQHVLHFWSNFTKRFKIKFDSATLYPLEEDEIPKYLRVVLVSLILSRRFFHFWTPISFFLKFFYPC